MSHTAPGQTAFTVLATPEAPADTDDTHNSMAPEPEEKRSALAVIGEWALFAVGSLVVALVIRSFLLQSYFIPSSSMESTLTIDDRVLVNKLSYAWSEPSRGDVVVFSRPPSVAGSIDHLIKRVIAVEGDTIESRDGVLYLNNEALDEPYLDEGTFTSSFGPVAIGEGMIWVMGDSRGNSSDSRVFGEISADSVVGRSFVQIWPLSGLEFL